MLRTEETYLFVLLLQNASHSSNTIKKSPNNGPIYLPLPTYNSNVNFCIPNVGNMVEYWLILQAMVCSQSIA